MMSTTHTTHSRYKLGCCEGKTQSVSQRELTRWGQGRGKDFWKSWRLSFSRLLLSLVKLNKWEQMQCSWELTSSRPHPGKNGIMVMPILQWGSECPTDRRSWDLNQGSFQNTLPPVSPNVILGKRNRYINRSINSLNKAMHEKASSIGQAHGDCPTNLRITILGTRRALQEKVTQWLFWLSLGNTFYFSKGLTIQGDR